MYLSKSVVSTYWSILFCFFILLSKEAQAVEWPQELSEPEGVITVYQPQPESLTGNILQGRAAMSVTPKGKKEPVFGAFWFTARIDSDHDKELVTIRDVKVTRVGWPDSEASSEARFTEIANRALGKTNFQISTSRLSASLASAKKERASLEGLKNDPPKIIFRDSLAVLLLFDGTPKFMDIEKTNYERAINTPFAVARDKGSKKVYLSNGAHWYIADDALGPWSVTKDPPATLVKLAPKSDSKTDSIPNIVVATEPTELIVSDGKPNWQILTAGKLMYVKNTETPWLRETSENKMFILLSGRWFSSADEAGPWTFVRPDQLPASFKEIPPDSDIGGVRVSVAGTEEANKAMLEAQIPQTSAINRNKAQFSASYDGEPKFEAIAGTKVSYAVNTSSQVLLIAGAYYAVDNGVWFTSKAPKGPWTVADKIPQKEISEIPSSSPVYNTTYVQIYDSTPEIVYVGYTPGYMWSYPYYGVPFYGTGWYYPPYYGAAYYPRPPTWGLHVGYNPWTGWNFGVSWSAGFFSFSIGWAMGGGYYGPHSCCGGYYGGGYRPAPVIVNTGSINIGNTVNAGNRTKVSNRMQSGDRSFTRNNVYERPENRVRNADASTLNRSASLAKPSPQKLNDVFADKDGNLAREHNGQWQSRENGKWTSQDLRPTKSELSQNPGREMSRDRMENRDTMGQTRFDRQSFERDFNARRLGSLGERRGMGHRR